MRSLLLLYTVVLGVFGFTPQSVQAQKTSADLLRDQLKEAGETGAGYAAEGSTDPLAFVAKIIKAAISLLGIIFLALTIYGGYLWMMARGNEQQVEKAKEVLKAGVIGMAIMLAAYIISVNVLSALLTATGQKPSPLYSL